jgi:PAS domain S-box-containing protein
LQNLKNGTHNKQLDTTSELTGQLVALRQRVAQLEASEAQFKRMEKALRESEERYRSLVRQSSDGVYLFDPNTAKIVEANPQFIKMLGYTEEELTSLTLYDITVLDRATIETNIAKISAAGQYVFGLRQYRRKGGSFVDVEINSSMVRYGEAHVVMVNVRNVTERKRAEEELQRHAATLRDQAELLDVAEDAIMVHDMNERIIFWNQGSVERYGWTKEQALGRTVHELLHTKFFEPRNRIKAAVLSDGRWEGELMHTRRDGAQIIVESRWALRRDKNGDPIAIMEINNDITKRKQAEESLQKAKESLEQRVAERTAELSDANDRLTLELNRRKQIEEMLRKGAERYRNLFENSPIGIYRTNPDGRILMANPTLIRLLGYSSFNEFASRKSKRGDYEPTYLKRRFRARLEKEGRVRGFEAAWKRRDKSVIFVRENAKAIRGTEEDATVLYYEGTVEDISERRKAEDKIHSYQKQLRSLASDLSLAEERERRRIATTLHDHIGQILAVSKIKLGVLLDLAKTSVFVENLREIREYVEQAIQYTRSLTFELSPPILYDLGLEAALEWLGEQIEEQHAIHCEFEADSHAKPVSDEVRVFLFTAVRELLVNVAKHANARKVKVTVRKIEDNLSIHVADDGIGFNAAKMNFYLDENKGFGLFSIRERLHHLGGLAEVKSQRARGTRIVLTAPLKTLT